LLFIATFDASFLAFFACALADICCVFHDVAPGAAGVFAHTFTVVFAHSATFFTYFAAVSFLISHCGLLFWVNGYIFVGYFASVVCTHIKVLWLIPISWQL